MRSQIIEIIGPPGIGKTTLYNALGKKWQNACSWTYQEALLTPTPSFADFRNWVEYKMKRVLKKKLSKTVATEYGFRFAQSHPQLGDFCWHCLSGENIYAKTSVEMQFRSAALLYTDFCRYQAIIEKAPSHPCIVNEGLLQKSFLIQGTRQNMVDLTNQYLSLVPLPVAVIYINTGKELIAERLMNREKVIASHVGKTRNELLTDIVKWQTRFELTATWMSVHGVPVYNVDGARPVKENVFTILKFLKTNPPNGKVSIL